MRFSLKTAHFTMLAIVLVLGLPLLLPDYLLLSFIDLAWRLTIVGLAVRAFYARGEQQAFALGGLAMGVVTLVHDDSDYGGIASYFAWAHASIQVILATVFLFVPLYLGALVGRWAYRHQLQLPTKPPTDKHC